MLGCILAATIPMVCAMRSAFRILQGETKAWYDANAPCRAMTVLVDLALPVDAHPIEALIRFGSCFAARWPIQGELGRGTTSLGQALSKKYINARPVPPRWGSTRSAAPLA